MKRSIKILLILLLCVACRKEETPPPVVNDRPSITTKIPLPNNTSDIEAGRVEEDITKATSFDETIDESLLEYFEMQGISSDEANIEMHRSNTTLRINYGVNPSIQTTLVSRTIFNAFAIFDVSYDECEITIEYVPGERNIIVNITGTNGDAERIEYNLKEDTYIESNYSSYINDAIEQFINQKNTNPLLLGETFEYVKYLMENAYHIQDDDYVLDDAKVMEIQKLIARSGLYSLPLSFTHTQYSMFIKDDTNILIMIDGFNNININYYKYETMMIPYEDGELPVTLIYANGYISFAVAGYEAQRYEYLDGEVRLVANDGDEAVSLGIEDKLLAVSKDYEANYSSIKLRLIELIKEIEELITRKS